MIAPQDPCKGCVCVGCKISDKNGALGVCPSKCCKRCEGSDDFRLRLAYCEVKVPIDEKGEPFTR